MALVPLPLEGIGKLGIVRDVPDTTLPPNFETGVFAWSDGNNVYFRDNSIIRTAGWMQIFGTPIVTPHYIAPIVSLSTQAYYWVYLGLAKAYVTDGATHTDITRVAGDYTGGVDNSWQRTLFGGIPIFNNGVDLPQYWSPQNTATRLLNLSAWPATYRAEVFRSYNGKLVAFNVLKDSTRYSHLVKWSHGATPGSLPASWDETNPTVDAGEWLLTSAGDAIVNALPMDDKLLIYRERSVDYMQPSGDVYIFSFGTLHSDYGIPSKNCVAMLPNGRHAVFTGTEIIVHNGRSSQNILYGRFSEYVKKNINVTTYKRAFLVPRYVRNELLLCIPTDGSYPTEAVVWNWQDNTLTLRDLPSATSADQGATIILTAADLWDNDAGTWDSDTSTWNDKEFDPATRNLVIASSDGKLYLDDYGTAQGGAGYVSFVERTGFGVPFHKERPADITSVKDWQGVYLRAKGTKGQKLKVYFGGRNEDQTDIWEAPVDFIIGEDIVARPPDGAISARLLALRIESGDSLPFTIEGIDLEVYYGGAY